MNNKKITEHKVLKKEILLEESTKAKKAFLTTSNLKEKKLKTEIKKVRELRNKRNSFYSLADFRVYIRSLFNMQQLLKKDTIKNYVYSNTRIDLKLLDNTIYTKYTEIKIDLIDYFMLLEDYSLISAFLHISDILEIELNITKDERELEIIEFFKKERELILNKQTLFNKKRATNKKLDNKDKLIYNKICELHLKNLETEHKLFSSTFVANSLGITKDAAYYRINKLKELGYLEVSKVTYKNKKFYKLEQKEDIFLSKEEESKIKKEEKGKLIELWEDGEPFYIQPFWNISDPPEKEENIDEALKEKLDKIQKKEIKYKFELQKPFKYLENGGRGFKNNSLLCINLL